MTLDHAMTSPAPGMHARDLWRALQTIGQHKLALRNTAPGVLPYFGILPGTRKMYAALRPYNARLDVLQAEMEERRPKGYRAN